MNNIINNLKNVRSKIPLSDKKLSIVIGISCIIIIMLIVFYVLSKKKYKKINPTFITKQKNAKKKYKISSKLVYNPSNGYTYTWNIWMYINNWSYKLNSMKHILTRGRLEKTPIHCNPSIWLGDKTNDLHFYIETDKKGTQEFILKDVPIKKWTMITIVLQMNEFEVYINGNLVETYILKSLPKLNNGNVYINEWGGYDGFITNLKYFPKTLSPLFIQKLYKKKPGYNKNVFKSLFGPITNNKQTCVTS